MGIQQNIVIETNMTCKLKFDDLHEFVVALHRHSVQPNDEIEVIVNKADDHDTIYFKLRGTIQGERI